MAKNRLFRQLLWLTAFISTAAFAQQPIDLHTALGIAETSNLELRAARQQRALALAGILTSRALPNPTVAFTAARDTPHEGVSFDLPVELGGKRGKRIAVAQEEQRSTEIDIAVLGRQVRHRTRDAFFRALAARAETAQAKTALDLSTRVRDLVQQRYESGAIAELEVVQADVELAKSNADYETTAQAQRAADVTLAALLNRDANSVLTISGRLEELPGAQPLDQLTSQALQSNSDLLKSTQDLKTEERRLDLAKAQRIPNLDLSVGADFNSPPDFRTGGKGGVAVTLPLFYRGQGEINQSSARIELLRLTMASQRNLVSAAVASAFFDYEAKAHQAELYRDKIVPQSVRVERMAEDSYQAGKTNILTLLDAQRRLNETQRAYLDSLLAAQNAFATLEEAVGISLD